MEYDSEKKRDSRRIANANESSNETSATLQPPVFQLQTDTESEEPSQEDISARVASIRRNYQSMIYNARSIGANVAADNLQAFIDGSVDERILSVEWLRSFGAVTRAEDRIKGYFESRNFTRFASDVEDGGTFIENDYYIGDIQEYNPLSELAYASGASKTRGDGTFNVKRDDNLIDISGDLIMNWWDPYDWEEGSSFWIPGSGTISDDDGLFLKEHGGAKDFMMRAAWKIKYDGQFDINTGRLTRSTFTLVGPVTPDRGLAQLPRPNQGGESGDIDDGTDDEVDTGRRRRNNREGYRRDRDIRRDRENNRRL